MDSKRELTRAADVAIAGLKQPEALTVCFGCLMALGTRLVDEPSSMKYLTATCHELFTTIMAFLSQDWTEARRTAASRALLRSYAACPKCNPGGRGHGKTRGGPIGPEFALACVSASTAIAAALSRWLGQLDKGNPFANKHGSWPASAEELFPLGPTQTMMSLLLLIDAGIEVHGLVLSILAAHRPLALPALSLPENRARFIGAFIRRMNAANSAISSDVAKLRAPVIPAVRDRIAQRHIAPLQLTAQLMLSIFVHPDCDEEDGARFIRGRETEVFGALTAVIDHLSDPLATHNGLTRLAAIVWNFVPGAQPRRLGNPATPWYIRQLEEEVVRELGDPYLALHSSLFEQTARRGCHGRDCRKTVHEKETAGAFQRCGKCRAVAYCSRECQRADWAHEVYPHKAVCDSLRELFSFADMKMRPEEFAAACSTHNFAFERVDSLIEWAGNRDGKIGEKVVSEFARGKGYACAESSGRVWALPSAQPQV